MSCVWLYSARAHGGAGKRVRVRVRSEQHTATAFTQRERINKALMSACVRACENALTVALRCAVPPLHLRRHVAADLKPVSTQSCRVRARAAHSLYSTPFTSTHKPNAYDPFVQKLETNARF